MKRALIIIFAITLTILTTACTKEKMSVEEFTKHEKEILIQTEAIGVPYKDNLSKNTKT